MPLLAANNRYRTLARRMAVLAAFKINGYFLQLKTTIHVLCPNP